jgi:dienelactone hydrolase
MGEITKVMDGGLIATLHLPRVAGRRPAVIVLSGSEGGVAGANLFGEPLAANGFVALCLAYFAMDGLPPDLTEIPLEYFNRAIEWLRGHAAVDGDRLAVFGSSRGGEAALLVGATFPDIKAVVANVPSHVVWQGMSSDSSQKTSSWSLVGEALPFVPLVTPRLGTTWREWFEASLSQPAVPAEATIPVERINGSILFVTGTHDGIWPCSTMADRAMERLRRHRFAFHAEHARYEGGGHAILMPPYRVGPIENPWPLQSYRQPEWMRAGLPALALGGTAEGNYLARMDAWKRMVAFLKQHLSADGLEQPVR